MIKIGKLNTLSKYFKWEFLEFTKFVPGFEYWVKDKLWVYDAD